jgi:hypothetical protein
LLDAIVHGLLGESCGVTALPGAVHLERLTVFSNLKDGGAHLRVGGPLAVEDDTDMFHGFASTCERHCTLARRALR